MSPSRPALHALALLPLLVAPLAAQARPAAKDRVVRPTVAVAEREPTFQGRTLSAWAEELTTAAAPLTRNQAAYALCGFGEQAAPAVPALIRALGDEFAVVRYPAALCLGEVGPAAAAAIPALEELLDDRNEDVAHIARRSLRRIRGEG